jgi:hypothetical protein
MLEQGWEMLCKVLGDIFAGENSQSLAVVKSGRGYGR